MSAVDTPLSQKHAAAVTQPQEQASDDGDDAHSFTSIASSVEDQEALMPESSNSITYTMLRDKKRKGHINVQVQGPGTSQVSTQPAYSMVQHATIPNAAREEITLYEGDNNALATQEDSATPPIGGVNFHHWLRDRSRSIVSRTRSGEADLKHPFGSSLGTHVLRLPSSGDEVKWVRASFEDTNSSLRSGRRRSALMSITIP